MISTRGRYAIRIVLELAAQEKEDFLPMKEVASRQQISLKYIERIMPAFRNSGLIESVHGTGGGYRLLKDAGDITLWDILVLTEGDMAPVACLQSGAAPCPRSQDCRTLSVWNDYYLLTKQYFSGITLKDLQTGKKSFLP